MVQWLRLHTSTAGGAGSIPGWETKIPNAVQCGQKKKKIREENMVVQKGQWKTITEQPAEDMRG